MFAMGWARYDPFHCPPAALLVDFHLVSWPPWRGSPTQALAPSGVQPALLLTLEHSLLRTMFLHQSLSHQSGLFDHLTTYSGRLGPWLFLLQVYQLQPPRIGSCLHLAWLCTAPC